MTGSRRRNTISRQQLANVDPVEYHFKGALRRGFERFNGLEFPHRDWALAMRESIQRFNETHPRYALPLLIDWVVPAELAPASAMEGAAPSTFQIGLAELQHEGPSLLWEIAQFHAQSLIRRRALPPGEHADYLKAVVSGMAQALTSCVSPDERDEFLRVAADPAHCEFTLPDSHSKPGKKGGGGPAQEMLNRRPPRESEWEL